MGHPRFTSSSQHGMEGASQKHAACSRRCVQEKAVGVGGRTMGRRQKPAQLLLLRQPHHGQTQPSGREPCKAASQHRCEPGFPSVLIETQISSSSHQESKAGRWEAGEVWQFISDNNKKEASLGAPAPVNLQRRSKEGVQKLSEAGARAGQRWSLARDGYLEHV